MLTLKLFLIQFLVPIRGCPRGKDVFFEEVLADKLFHIFPEASTVDGMVPFTVIVRQYSSASGSVELYWIGFKGFTTLGP